MNNLNLIKALSELKSAKARKSYLIKLEDKLKIKGVSMRLSRGLKSEIVKLERSINDCETILSEALGLLKETPDVVDSRIDDLNNGINHQNSFNTPPLH